MKQTNTLADRPVMITICPSFIIWLAILLFLSSNLYSQDLENMGAGVIDFLLRNPKTANRMKAEQAIALDIIGDLLKTESERNFQLKYASAGQNQITINTNEGRQAQFVKNEQGRIFLLIDGVVYPIAQELVNEATGNKGYSTPSYSSLSSPSLSDIAKWFDEPETIRYKEPYYVKIGGEYLRDISRNTGIPIEYIGDENYHMLPEKYRENRGKLSAGRKLTIAKEYYKTGICIPVLFKWVKDLDGSGFVSLDEFKQIKNEFYDNENFKIAIFYVTEKHAEGILKVELFNNYTGELIRSYTRDIGNSLERRFETFDISSNELPIGTYIASAKLLTKYTSATLAANNADFRIIEGNASTREVSNHEKNYRTNNTSYSTPHGIFYCNSWSDLNGNGRYDNNEFIGLNKESYSLSRDSLWVNFNFSDKSGEIIVQSWTKDGRLLGTTTKPYQRLMGNWIYPKNDPYRSRDFIDMVQLNGPGKYTITVNFVEGGIFEKDLILTE